ncbi:MAG: DUF1173 domain-containing protein [Gordonia polyisoprenivorans]|nr:DUF1173 domain-containing protein [Gordonia polyisoprenivorans]
MTSQTTGGGYRLAEQTLEDVTGEPAQKRLAVAHRGHERPLCWCVPGGVPMYVARAGRVFIVKRMPGTGPAHARTCASWTAPEQLSGLGQVQGSAITEDPDSGLTALRLDFSLSQNAGRAAPAAAGGASDTVAADGTKLTLRAMLHYLWDDAGFTSWTPRMAGKRSWRVVSWHLRQTARTKTTKGAVLSSRLFVPEPFDPDRKAELSARRLNAWAPARAQRGSSSRPLLLLVGEVKEISPSRFGHKMVIKHMPDAPVMLDDDIHRRMLTTFADDLALWEAGEHHHLMVIATFSVGPTGLASAVRLALMCTDEHWLPIANDYDRLLITAAVDQQRRFTVGMRYNLPADTPLAALTLTDTDPVTAVHYSTGDAAEFAEVIAAEGLGHWHWDIDEELPPFPPAQHRGTNPTAPPLSPLPPAPIPPAPITSATTAQTGTPT